MYYIINSSLTKEYQVTALLFCHVSEKHDAKINGPTTRTVTQNNNYFISLFFLDKIITIGSMTRCALGDGLNRRLL